MSKNWEKISYPPTAQHNFSTYQISNPKSLLFNFLQCRKTATILIWEDRTNAFFTHFFKQNKLNNYQADKFFIDQLKQPFALSLKNKVQNFWTNHICSSDLILNCFHNLHDLLLLYLVTIITIEKFSADWLAVWQNNNPWQHWPLVKWFICFKIQPTIKPLKIGLILFFDRST